MNTLSSWTVLHSVDGVTYSVSSAEQIFKSGINSVSLGLENVKKLQILITKNSADDISQSGGKNAYIFSLDSLEITSDKYEKHSESTLYCGPYEIRDEFNDPVNFSLATIDKGTCCVTPGVSSVSFYLSKDNLNWMPASYTGDSYKVVQFNSTNPEQSVSLIDKNLSRTKLLIEPTGIVDIEYSKEALLNLFISEEWSSRFVLRNT